MLLVLAAFTLGIGYPSDVARAHAADLDAELARLLELIEGSYVGEAPRGFSPDGATHELLHIFARVKAPQFGETVLYYQISHADAPHVALQAKIFVFDTASGRTANRMRAFILDPASDGSNLHQTPGAFDRLQPAQLFSFPSTCFLEWQQKVDEFEALGSPECVYPSKAFKQDISPQMTYRVSMNGFAFEEILKGEDGAPIVTTGGLLFASRIQHDALSE